MARKKTTPDEEQREVTALEAEGMNEAGNSPEAGDMPAHAPPETLPPGMEEPSFDTETEEEQAGEGPPEEVPASMVVLMERAGDLPPVSEPEDEDWSGPAVKTPEDFDVPPGVPMELPPLPPELDEVALQPPKSERQKFYELDFREMDRDLSPEERREWSAIYASYRGRSALRGRIMGVDPMRTYIYDRRTRQYSQKTMLCATVVRYRIPITIPLTEMWESGNERPDFVFKGMVGAEVSFIITKVEREAEFAVASRRLAMRAERYFFARHESLNDVGSRLKCRMLAVGPRRCLVECYGHDIEMTQRDLKYMAIPNLKLEYHPGQELPCIVKSYDPVTDDLVISVKEVESNPFDGAEFRHPVGCRRYAVIAGKYGGGVFCNLPDGTIFMCNYSYQHDDTDFKVGDNVILSVEKYDHVKKQSYGRIMSKW